MKGTRRLFNLFENISETQAISSRTLLPRQELLTPYPQPACEKVTNLGLGKGGALTLPLPPPPPLSHLPHYLIPPPFLSFCFSPKRRACSQATLIINPEPTPLLGKVSIIILAYLPLPFKYLNLRKYLVFSIISYSNILLSLVTGSSSLNHESW